MMLRDVSLLRMQDSLQYLRQSYVAKLAGNVEEAKRCLELSNIMERRAKRHWIRATRRVDDE